MKLRFVYIFFVLLFISFYCTAQNEKFKTIQYTTSDGGKIEADLFLAKKNIAVIFAHGAIFNKESWHFLALKMQRESITSLALNFRGYGKSKKGTSNILALDVKGAITYLQNKGYKSIAIVGASMGGAAVIRALNTSYNKDITKVVLMAPAGGKALIYKTLNKLFIVSEKEGLYKRVITIYKNSAEPKKLSVYKGSAHAQHMFKAKYAKRLIKEIIDFIK